MSLVLPGITSAGRDAQPRHVVSPARRVAGDVLDGQVAVLELHACAAGLGAQAHLDRACAPGAAGRSRRSPMRSAACAGDRARGTVLGQSRRGDRRGTPRPAWRRGGRAPHPPDHRLRPREVLVDDPRLGDVEVLGDLVHGAWLIPYGRGRLPRPRRAAPPSDAATPSRGADQRLPDDRALRLRAPQLWLDGDERRPALGDGRRRRSDVALRHGRRGPRKHARRRALHGVRRRDRPPAPDPRHRRPARGRFADAPA